MRSAAALLAFAAIAASPALADDGSKAAEAIELFYIQSKAISPVRCRSTDVDGTRFVLCNHPEADSQTGGLWAALPGPAVVPINGKAMTIMKRFGPGMQAIDGSEVEVKKAQEAFPEPPAIPEILAQF